MNIISIFLSCGVFQNQIPLRHRRGKYNQYKAECALLISKGIESSSFSKIKTLSLMKKYRI